MQDLGSRRPQEPALTQRRSAVPGTGTAREPTENTLMRRPRHALLVDADAATNRICREVLEETGFAVHVVHSGIAAVVAARDRPFDLIVIDTQLRDVPGREAMEWLRSNPALRSTPLIALASSAEGRSNLFVARPGTLLRKPISVAMIRRAIHDLLNQEA